MSCSKPRVTLFNVKKANGKVFLFEKSKLTSLKIIQQILTHQGHFKLIYSKFN